MQTMFFSPDVSLFAGVRRDGPWFVGQVTALQGRAALRVSHECLPLRTSRPEALQDACSDARKLIPMWAQKTRI